MPLYNFKEQFVPMVQNGSKRQTVRAYRLDGRLPKIGEPCHLFTGLRTNHAQRLRQDNPPAKDAETIYFYPNNDVFISNLVILDIARQLLANKKLLIANTHHAYQLTQEQKNRFAWKDGFRPDGSTIDFPLEAFALMLSFWKNTHSLPFTGTITYW